MHESDQILEPWNSRLYVGIRQLVQHFNIRRSYWQFLVELLYSITSLCGSRATLEVYLLARKWYDIGELHLNNCVFDVMITNKAFDHHHCDCLLLLSNISCFAAMRVNWNFFYHMWTTWASLYAEPYGRLICPFVHDYSDWNFSKFSQFTHVDYI